MFGLKVTFGCEDFFFFENDLSPYADVPAHGGHEPLQLQRHDGIQQSTRGRRSGGSQLDAHGGAYLEMISPLQKQCWANSPGKRQKLNCRNPDSSLCGDIFLNSRQEKEEGVESYEEAQRFGTTITTSLSSLPRLFSSCESPCLPSEHYT